MEDKMLVLRADELTPEQLYKLIDNTQRFFIKGLGMDREVVGDILVKRIMSSGDPLAERKYYIELLDSLVTPMLCNQEVCTE